MKFFTVDYVQGNEETGENEEFSKKFAYTLKAMKNYEDVFDGENMLEDYKELMTQAQAVADNGDSDVAESMKRMPEIMKLSSRLWAALWFDMDSKSQTSETVQKAMETAEDGWLKEVASPENFNVLVEIMGFQGF